jgi:hypothetical protein
MHHYTRGKVNCLSLITDPAAQQIGNSLVSVSSRLIQRRNLEYPDGCLHMRYQPSRLLLSCVAFGSVAASHAIRMQTCDSVSKIFGLTDSEGPLHPRKPTLDDFLNFHQKNG